MTPFFSYLSTTDMKTTPPSSFVNISITEIKGGMILSSYANSLPMTISNRSKSVVGLCSVSRIHFISSSSSLLFRLFESEPSAMLPSSRSSIPHASSHNNLFTINLSRLDNPFNLPFASRTFNKDGTYSVTTMTSKTSSSCLAKNKPSKPHPAPSSSTLFPLNESLFIPSPRVSKNHSHMRFSASYT